MVSEEYYFLTALAHARCSAELEMPDVAVSEIVEAQTFWQTEARRVATCNIFSVIHQNVF